MKTARLITLLGGILLGASAAFHASGYPRFLVPMIQKDGIGWPISGVLKASWLTFSILLFALAVLSVLARNMEGGGLLLLVVAAANAACAMVMWCFLGFFPGVYLIGSVAILLAIGGALQVKKSGTRTA